VEIDGQPPLFIFANPPETDVPSRTDPKVRWFEAGKVHESGEVVLESGQTLYVEGGAVLRGSVRAKNGRDVTIRGRGIIDGCYWSERRERRRGVLLEDCDRVKVEGVTIVNPAGWTLVLYACHGVHVANVKEIAEGFGSDGIDVVSSRDVVVEDCFLRNGDDNLVVKAFAAGEGRGRGGDVDNVLFQRCVLLGHGGSAIEIGHELRADEIRNVTFRDCDVLCVHGHGAAMSIHNADHATVRDIVYEDIRVEHHFTHLVDLRVFASRWGKDAQRGRIRNVLLRNIRVAQSEFNPGYTVSLIGGCDAQHDVDGVVVEDLYLGGSKVTTPDQMDLYLKHAANVKFV
jgi:polygalacturonase